jgi:hypothetical protein
MRTHDRPTSLSSTLRRARLAAIATASSIALIGACGGDVVVDPSSVATTSSTNGTGGSVPVTTDSTATTAVGAGGGTPSNVLSCLVSMAGIEICAEYASPSASFAAQLQAACMGNNGTLGQGCPTANVLGTCALTMMGVAGTEVFYTTGGLAPSEAEMSCTSAGGTWTAG